MFPYSYHFPAILLEILILLLISFNISINLGYPIVSIRLRLLITSGTTMPETPVHKDTYLPGDHHHIGLEIQFLELVSEAVSIAQTKQDLPEKDLRLSVLTLYLRHYLAADFFREYVCHSISMDSGFKKDFFSEDI